MDLNQNYPNTNIEMVPRSSEDDQNSNKTGPALNSQDYIPKEYNNPDFQQILFLKILIIQITVLKILLIILINPNK